MGLCGPSPIRIGAEPGLASSRYTKALKSHGIGLVKPKLDEQELAVIKNIKVTVGGTFG
jgi:hypothetical protein